MTESSVKRHKLMVDAMKLKKEDVSKEKKIFV